MPLWDELRLTPEIPEDYPLLLTNAKEEAYMLSGFDGRIGDEHRRTGRLFDRGVVEFAELLEFFGAVRSDLEDRGGNRDPGRMRD